MPLHLPAPGHRHFPPAGLLRLPDPPTLLLRRLPHRRKILATPSPVLAASFGTCTHRGGRSTCRCQHGGLLPTGQHLTLKEHGKTRSVYLPQELLAEVHAGLAEHRRRQQLLQEIHQRPLALLRARARSRKRKAGRP